jgi:hypothetical protein
MMMINVTPSVVMFVSNNNSWMDFYRSEDHNMWVGSYDTTIGIFEYIIKGRQVTAEVSNLSDIIEILNRAK